MAATAFTDRSNRREKACKKEETIYGLNNMQPINHERCASCLSPSTKLENQCDRRFVPADRLYGWAKQRYPPHATYELLIGLLGKFCNRVGAKKFIQFINKLF